MFWCSVWWPYNGLNGTKENHRFSWFKHTIVKSKKTANWYWLDRKWSCSISSFLCSILSTNVYLFCPFLSFLSVFLRIMAIHYPFSTKFCFRFAIIFEKRYGRHNMAKKILYRGLFSSLLYFLFIFYLPISCICSLGLSIVEVITEISSSIIEQI